MATVNKYLKVRKGIDTPDVLTSSATVFNYFKTPVVYFNTTASITPITGGLAWSDGSGTLSLGLKNGNINLDIGQKELALCYNGTASSLSIGTVVRVVGAQGQRPKIDLSDATNDPASSKTFGLVSETITPGSEGFITTLGIVSNVNTSNFTVGDVLWLSPSAGLITNVKPIQPYHNVFLGYCLKSHPSAGQIFVKIQNGYEVDELHDVLISTASTNQTLIYNSASGLWQNKALLEVIKEIDGTGSGIDTDLLDGQQGTYYLDWTNFTNKPDPIIGVNLLGDITGAASVTLTDITNGQISINTTVAANSIALGTDTTGNYVVGATAGNGITISGTAGEGWSPTIEVNAAASVAWGNISSKPSPVIGVNLTGVITGAASATLSQLTNGQVSITTGTSTLATDSTVVHLAGTETVTGSKTFSANLTMSSADILMGSTLGDRITLWGTHDSTSAYAIGIENDTQYFKSGGSTFRWYMGVNADGGTSDKMELNSTGLTINGSLTATTKSFDIEHPTKENMRLRYGSLEGPENGVYVRGKSNSSTITLPDYWTGLVDEDSITVQLTSIGRKQDLFVEDISNNTIKVGGVEGEYFYLILAERKDVDKLVVEYGS